MRRLLSIPALIALSLSLLAGCSGDDGEPEGGTDEPTAGESSEIVGTETKGCRADVAITGAVETSWTGKAEVRRSGSEPTAVYTAESGEASISAFSPIGDNNATANVTLDGQTYTTPLGVDAGLEIAEDGSGARIDADAIGIEGPGVHIDATFECAGKGKRGKQQGRGGQDGQAEQEDGQDDGAADDAGQDGAGGS